MQKNNQVLQQQTELLGKQVEQLQKSIANHLSMAKWPMQNTCNYEEIEVNFMEANVPNNYKNYMLILQ